MAAKRSSPSLRERLASAVRARRVQLGWTQEEAAERAGLSPRYWRAIETTKPAIRLEILERMLAGLGWTWGELAKQIEDPTAEDSAPHSLLKSVWRDASARDREILLATLRLYARHTPRK